jgi:hypothetical protein
MAGNYEADQAINALNGNSSEENHIKENPADSVGKSAFVADRAIEPETILNTQGISSFEF